MTEAAALVIGYLIGSLPTANALAHLWGVDLRTGGTGNPGANNARRLGGPVLAVIVLLVEAIKGAVAVLAGGMIAGDPGSVLAAVGAAGGNVYNVWYSFRGGKGLGITLGTLFVAWPGFLPIGLVVLGVASASTRSTGIGSLVTMVVMAIASLIWPAAGIGTAWGVAPEWLWIIGIGVPAILWRPHWKDARARIRRPAPL